MQVNQIDNSYNTNFKALFEVSCAYIGTQRYSRGRNIQKIHWAAKALASGMYNNTLPDNVKEQVKFFFPDFDYKTANTVLPVRQTSDNDAHRIYILTGQQAINYNKAQFMGATPEEKDEIEQDELFKMSYTKRRHKKRSKSCLTIKAKEVGDGKLAITGVEYFQPIEDPNKQQKPNKD